MFDLLLLHLRGHARKYTSAITFSWLFSIQDVDAYLHHPNVPDVTKNQKHPSMTVTTEFGGTYAATTSFD